VWRVTLLAECKELLRKENDRRIQEKQKHIELHLSWCKPPWFFLSPSVSAQIRLLSLLVIVKVCLCFVKCYSRVRRALRRDLSRKWTLVPAALWVDRNNGITVLLLPGVPFLKRHRTNAYWLRTVCHSVNIRRWVTTGHSEMLTACRWSHNTVYSNETFEGRPFYFLFFSFSGWGETEFTWYVGHCCPIVPAPIDRWWLWSSGWNENWQGKPKYWEKTCPSATLSTTNP
jgi:hypothetical protein